MSDTKLGAALQQRLAPPRQEERPVAAPARESLASSHGNAYGLRIRGTRRYLVGPDGEERFVGHRPKGRA